MPGKLARTQQALTNVRRRAREQTENLFEVGVSAGTGFLYGYTRARGQLAAQYANVDSDLLLGTILTALGFMKGRYSRILRQSGDALLAIWFAGYGERKAAGG